MGRGAELQFHEMVEGNLSENVTSEQSLDVHVPRMNAWGRQFWKAKDSMQKPRGKRNGQNTVWLKQSRCR